jgi:uncharacterized ferritin-like protein (DUF455 family)
MTISTNPTNLLEYAILVLNTNDTKIKVSLTYEAQTRLQQGSMPIGNESLYKDANIFQTSLKNEGSIVARYVPPEHPARPLDVETIDVNALPAPKQNDAQYNRIRLLHSLAHIESYAIDLSWDILVRWSLTGVTRKEIEETVEGISNDPCSNTPQIVYLPRDFFEDWLRVAVEEARHFTIWANRLEELGSHYGALPVHDGLWESAATTANSLLARLAIVHLVHESSGLDHTGRMASQMASLGDKKSEKLLHAIESDELTHVASGVRWFEYICHHYKLHPQSTYQQMVRKHFRGSIRGPFNDEMRNSAGLTRDWWEDLLDDKERELEAERKRKAEAKKMAELKRIQDMKEKREQARSKWKFWKAENSTEIPENRAEQSESTNNGVKTSENKKSQTEEQESVIRALEKGELMF